MYWSSLIPVSIIATQLPLLEFFQILVCCTFGCNYFIYFEVTIQSHALLNIVN